MKGPTNSSARPNIRLLNVSATFESNPDTSNNTEFPYRASIQADGVSEYMSATVMFSQIQATSGNFATYCQTDEDVVYIYSKTDVGTITIPAVSCDLSVNYINVDNVPTEDSQAVITSGGVYDALENKLTKDANLTDGDPLVWDAANYKAITAAIPSAISTALAGKQDTLIYLSDIFSENLTSAVPVYNLGSITAPKTGIMILTIAGSFGNNANGYRLIGFSRNSTSVLENWLFNTNANTDVLYFSVTMMIPITQGDVIRACAYQTSGSTVGVSGVIKGLIV